MVYKLIGRTVVTGSNGFIGSTIIHTLRRREIEFLGIKRMTNSDLTPDHGQESEKKTLAQWTESIIDYQPRNLILCDWQGVFSQDRRDDFQFNNVERWISIVKVARDCGVENIVALGSQAEIPALQDGVTEDEPFFPRSNYGDAKREAFFALSDITGKSNCNFIWARLFSVYGPTMSNKWFLKKIIHAIKEGTDLQTSPLTQIWNFLHQDDCASAIITILEGNGKGIYNIASASSVQLLEVINMITRIYGVEHNLRIGALPFRDDETFVMKPNIEKLLSLGWKEKYSLEDGLREVMQ